mmetsp:Transcript_36247/g.55677  ORF Transcript_36247/g.55677 Transcript_36247/m.55677 type:complete len:86 (-) Transcript_36247:408-665(-)
MYQFELRLLIRLICFSSAMGALVRASIGVGMSQFEAVVGHHFHVFRFHELQLGLKTELPLLALLRFFEHHLDRMAYRVIGLLALL